jgi:Domain of unknown function (DUF4190)
MPWYYAGPEAKPVGPISAEELHSRRAGGIISPETYVIEQTGQPLETLSWKRYQDLFPAGSAALPPLPPVPAFPPTPPPVPLTAQPHPLFPSAAPNPLQHPAFPHAPRPDPYYGKPKPTNGYCAWGFGLGVASLVLFIVCGLGLLPGIIAIPLCIAGLVQLHKHHEQSGKGLAIAGLVLSVLGLLLSLGVLISLTIPILKAHGLTITEQTSNDSE